MDEGAVAPSPRVAPRSAVDHGEVARRRVGWTSIPEKLLTAAEAPPVVEPAPRERVGRDFRALQR